VVEQAAAASTPDLRNRDPYASRSWMIAYLQTLASRSPRPKSSAVTRAAATALKVVVIT
jgi:hypothetical protein